MVMICKWVVSNWASQLQCESCSNIICRARLFYMFVIYTAQSMGEAKMFGICKVTVSDNVTVMESSYKSGVKLQVEN